jgi:hypothetical protein
MKDIFLFIIILSFGIFFNEISKMKNDVLCNVLNEVG